MYPITDEERIRFAKPILEFTEGLIEKIGLEANPTEDYSDPNVLKKVIIEEDRSTYAGITLVYRIQGEHRAYLGFGLGDLSPDSRFLPGDSHVELSLYNLNPEMEHEAFLQSELMKTLDEQTTSPFREHIKAPEVPADYKTSKLWGDPEDGPHQVWIQFNLAGRPEGIKLEEIASKLKVAYEAAYANP